MPHRHDASLFREGPMDERRHLKRRHLLYYLRVFDRGSGEQLGSLADITAEGLMLVSTDSIPTGRDFRLRMHLPPGITRDNGVEIDARSVWTRPDVNPEFHVTGFTLLSVTPGCVDAIEQLIDDYGFRD